MVNFTPVVFASSDDSGSQRLAQINQRQERFNRLFETFGLNTQKAMKSDWLDYGRYCQRVNSPEILLNPEQMQNQVRSYVLSMLERLKRATIKRRVNTLSVVLGYLEAYDPFSDKLFKKEISNRIDEISAPQGQATPLSKEMLIAFTEKMDRTSLKSVRDTLLVNLAFDTLCRSAELRVAEFSDVKFEPDGTGTLLVRRSKNDKSAVGSLRFISSKTVDLLELWQQMSGLEDGFIIRSVTHTGKLMPPRDNKKPLRPICHNTLVSAFKQVDFNLSGHSARVGSVIEQFRNDIKLYAVQQSGGWKSPLMPVHYGKQIETKNSGSAQLSKKLGR